MRSLLGLIFSPLSYQETKAYRCDPESDSKSRIMSVIVVKGTRPNRSVTEIKKVESGSKRANGKTNDVHNAPDKCLHSLSPLPHQD